MATLHRLTQLIGRLDHRGPRAVGRLAVALSEAGLVRVGGTGGAAVHQTYLDAAHLLLAVGANEPPADVARTVIAFAGAKARGTNWHAHGVDGCDAFDAIADASTLAEALVTAIEVAPEFVHLAQRRARALNQGSSEAAFDAAMRGLVVDIRLALFRPQCVACLRLVDSTDERGPVNLASIWFDAPKLDPLVRGGSCVTITSEFGISLIGPVAFELRDNGHDRDRAVGLTPITPPASASTEARANALAAGAGPIQPVQRRETVQAATRNGADSDGN